MSNQIQFKSFDFKNLPVRIIIDSTNEFWFCAKDICTILGYVNDTDALKKHCKEKGVAKRYSPTKGGNQEMVYINEPNLYRLIIKSRKPEAEPFEAWVFEEVLPQIRKTGQYSVKQQNLPLLEAEADEEAIRIIANLYHSLNGAYEMGVKIRKEYPHLGRDIDKFIGGHYLYNLNMPTENALEKARRYVQAKSERIMFIKGMLSLLDEQPQPKRLANF
ncbi:Bro-N domain-containing protein [Gallibacterium salpingitidis]|uniref:BRO-N domain-containing protein n=1 Tax=Gallibacterium salpingitidis TaxID=505341 RepID=UPI00266F5189|nr:Bro-N domain-containing protein [Gallibacterium salpingitidis]WKS98773.1 Bro-N domain-containing protein [Gallibacterium salpingitidis]